MGVKNCNRKSDQICTSHCAACFQNQAGSEQQAKDCLYEARWRSSICLQLGLARRQAASANGEKSPSAIDLHRELNALKKSTFPWMYVVSKCAPQETLRNLDKAFAHFFRRVKEKPTGRNIKVGFPRFKSRKNGLGSFRLTGAIQLPRLKERGYLPLMGVPILSATVREKAGRWFVSLQVDLNAAINVEQLLHL